MKILVTGANGYIGRCLIPALLSEGHDIFALVRSSSRFNLKGIKSKINVIEGDLLDTKTLDRIPLDIDVAYYLVHSMADSYKSFEKMEEECCLNFSKMILATRCRQIIYLSALAPKNAQSAHLRSRLYVEKLLGLSKIPLTVLKASIIIGSGSASFEIIRDLVEKLPVMIAPRWLSNHCQPIAIYDVIRYLIGVMNNPSCLNQTFEIAGPNVLTYREMLLEMARLRQLKRWIFLVPVLTPKLSSYWLYLVTSNNFQLAKALVESLNSDTVSCETKIQDIFKEPRLTYEEAITRAFSTVDQNEVTSSWKDAISLTNLHPDLGRYLQIPKNGCFSYSTECEILESKEAVIERLWLIGGRTGWYYANWIWRIRGFIDKLVGGVGLSRGRKNSKDLLTGDVVDFWRVIVSKKQIGRLLLYAEMKLPGEAWLEFYLKQRNSKFFLKQKATFRPRGLFGRLYWFSLYYVHIVIFEGMVRAIAQKPFSWVAQLKKNYLKLFFLIFALLGVMYSAGEFTQVGVKEWYPSLNKPSWTPANWVFPFAWTFLYVSMALSAWIVWVTDTTVKKKVAISLFAAQLLLNFLWSPLFFYFHWLELSLVDLVCLLFLVISTFRKFLNISPTAALFLLPYILWLIYAGFLNGWIVLNN